MIIGAGPVGLMLACELGAAGVVPIVLDRRTEPGDTPKANGIGGHIIDLLELRGLLDRLGEGSAFLGVPVGFPFGSVPLRFAGLDGIPLRMLLIQQPLLEERLRERAAELGVEVRWGQHVTGVGQDAEGVTVTGDGFGLRARHAVGCDGGSGRVRAMAGIGFPGTTDDEVVWLGHFAAPDTGIFADGPDLAPGWNRTPAGRVLATSLKPGVLVVGVREKGERPTGPVTETDFRAALDRVLGRDLPLGEPIWLSATVSQARLAERYRAGRVFLAGDAAHLFPAGGSALNVGMGDAVNLGWKLAAALRGGPDLLDTYGTERRAVAARALAQTRAQAALERAEGAEGEALRGMLAELFAHADTARHMAATLHGGDVRYDTWSPHPLAGLPLPDLPITTADGRKGTAGLLSEARPLVLDFGGAAGFSSDTVAVVRADCENPPADALLIRPDGYVAWAGGEGLAEAAGRLFGHR
ncbi:FAD-dependent oxidoreductase [Actinorhabdospora filicis]|uniref:FAD-dependent oxidoreductase n=1 Tax=Actinorhabdospora filicis TaxID=1785913 RepID=A0A9W6W3A1_9ACTN|nr:FAD-dependent oxidoreductase [Actinorhabdospora filicis]